MVHNGLFINKEHYKNLAIDIRLTGVWYDDSTRNTMGRGEKFDRVLVDTDLPKDYILDVIIPACRFAEKVLVFGDDGRLHNVGVDGVLEILN